AGTDGDGGRSHLDHPRVQRDARGVGTAHRGDPQHGRGGPRALRGPDARRGRHRARGRRRRDLPRAAGRVGPGRQGARRRARAGRRARRRRRVPLRHHAAVRAPGL
ncbi:MAG: hypothetical protein AVDCRST_MAG54-1808, partial [uncultured Actinomycetospora sp.]